MANVENCTESENMASKDQDDSQVNISTGDQHTCGICRKTFATSSQLQQHAWIHLQPFSCNLCHTRFTTEEYLSKHKLTHSKVMPYKCDVCDKRFVHECSMKLHKKLIHSGKKKKCHICNKEVIEGYFASHMKRHTGTSEKKFNCSECNKKFRNKKDLAAHLHMHFDFRPFTCEICKVGFRTKSSLTRHTATHTGIRPFQCDTCTKSYILFNYLKEHKQKCVQRKPKPKPLASQIGVFQLHICEICKTVHHTLSDLLLHKREHEKIRNRCPKGTHEQSEGSHIICNYCSMTFHNREELDNHLLKRKESRLCCLCDQLFKNSTEFKTSKSSTLCPTPDSAVKLVSTSHQTIETESLQEILPAAKTDTDISHTRSTFLRNHASSGIEGTRLTSNTDTLTKPQTLILPKTNTVSNNAHVRNNSQIVGTRKAGQIVFMNLYKCDYCTKVFSDAHALTSHVVTSHPMPYKCTLNNIVY